MPRWWHFAAARFKQRLSLSDLHAVTEVVFESATEALPDVFRALRESDPQADYGRLWRDGFAQPLEAIAAQQTRRSQAAECRRFLIQAVEAHALAGALLKVNLPLVSRMFFEQEATSDMSDELMTALVAKHFMLRTVDLTALTVLYKIQFNSTFRLVKFESDLTDLCKLSAECAWREASHVLVSSSSTEMEEGWDKFYVEVIHPASTELELIKRRYTENLCLLSPQNSDAKDFRKLEERTLKAIEPYL